MNASIMEDKPIIYIKTLGGLPLRADDKEIADNSSRSRKPWCPLGYLVIFRRRSIDPGEPISIVWADDPGVNPGGTLKTLMFRSRRLLELLGVPSQKLLIQQRSFYYWAQGYSSVLGIDQFEPTCTRVPNQDMDEAEAPKLCPEGLGLYKGDFLPRSEHESQVIPISTCYHSLYQKLVYKTVELLTKKGDFSRITSIYQTTVGIESFDEGFYYHLICSLHRDGHTSQAIEERNHTLGLSYNKFSISPSDHFRDLCEFTRSKEWGISTSPDSARRILKEEVLGGALYCEYPVLHDLLRLGRRVIERTDDPVYLCSLTISDLDERVPKATILNEAIGHLSHAIRDFLRYSDMCIRYNISQYIILLPIVTMEKGEMAVKRVLSSSRELCSHRELTVDHELQPVLLWRRSPAGPREQAKS